MEKSGGEEEGSDIVTWGVELEKNENIYSFQGYHPPQEHILASPK